MELLTPALRAALVANAAATATARDGGTREPDHRPVVKLFSPVGAATWLATELDADGDTLFGLADLGFGCPELGSFSLSEIAQLCLPFGLSIERDENFSTDAPLSVWADTARRAGSIFTAEQLIRAAPATTDQELPSSASDGGRRGGRVSPAIRKPVPPHSPGSTGPALTKE